MFKITFNVWDENAYEYKLKKINLKNCTQEKAGKLAIEYSKKHKKATLETDIEYINFREGIEWRRKPIHSDTPIGGNNYQIEGEIEENGKIYQYRKYVNSPEVKSLGGCYAIWCSDGRIKFCKNWMIRDKSLNKFTREGNI